MIGEVEVENLKAIMDVSSQNHTRGFPPMAIHDSHPRGPAFSSSGSTTKSA